jgi:hypothetical protein
LYSESGVCVSTMRGSYGVRDGIYWTRYKPKRGCLFHPKRVRLRLRTKQSGVWEGGNLIENTPQVFDHLPAKGQFTPWVKYSRD